MKNIWKTFELFFREPLSILRNGQIQLVNLKTNIFEQKPTMKVEMLERKTQITVINSDKMYGFLKTVMHRQKIKEREQELAIR